MLKHIVMWRFKEEALGKSRNENIDIFKTMLENLVGVVDEIVDLKVGKNIIPGDTASDLVLNSEFQDIDSLNAYSQHPEHQKVLAFGKQVISERRAVDYEF
ncbi:MAG: Dabb family protein [bacterium]